MVSALITPGRYCTGLSQLALGGWQIRQFNHAFDALCQRGRVGVGRSGGRFKPRVVRRWPLINRTASATRY